MSSYNNFFPQKFINQMELYLQKSIHDILPRITVFSTNTVIIKYINIPQVTIYGNVY